MVVLSYSPQRMNEATTTRFDGVNLVEKDPEGYRGRMSGCAIGVLPQPLRERLFSVWPILSGSMGQRALHPEQMHSTQV